MKVKICGIRTTEEAVAAITAGADALGFHIELEHSKCPIDAQRAAHIIRALPSGVLSVIVTTLTDANTIIKLSDDVAASAVQLQGETSVDSISTIRKKRPNLKLFRAVHVVSADAVVDAKQYEGVVDFILLDSKDLKTGARGGTGKTHDWNISRQVVKEVSVPVVLAGGLNADNVGEAIKIVQPFMVDVESGVSNPDGTKDIEKVKAFIAKAKQE